MAMRLSLTETEERVLRYLLDNVASDLEWDEDCGDFRDCGGIIACLTKEEKKALENVIKKLRKIAL
jgi:hypothetical protein